MSAALARRLTIRNRKGLHARASARFVSTVESFDADMATLAERAGLSVLSLGHLNRTQRDVGYPAHYDDRTAELVAEMYRDDIARFGYQFGG